MKASNLMNSQTPAYERYLIHKIQTVVQFERVKSAIEQPNTNIDDPIAPIRTALAEIHLLYIAMRNTWNMIVVVLDGIDEKKAIDFKKITKCQRFFNDVDEVRNYFEHYDKRIQGVSKQKFKPVKSSPEAGERRIHVGLSGFKFKFSDKEFDVGDKTKKTYIEITLAFENLIDDEPFKYLIL
ncbi:hypothetical protein GN278_04515 [Rhodobacteraceae bacterium Araon29]